MTETIEELWIYMGARYASKRLVNAWMDKNGTVMYFYKVPASVIGGSYQVDITTENDKTYVHGSPRFVEAKVADEEAIESWIVEDAAARYDRESDLEEKRIGKDANVESALNVLRHHFQTCKSYSAKWTFAQYIASEVSRPPTD